MNLLLFLLNTRVFTIGSEILKIDLDGHEHLKPTFLKIAQNSLERIYKTPYLNNQGGYNSESYKGFLKNNRIDRFDQDQIDKTRFQGADLRGTDQPNYFFTNTFKLWFCTFSAGARSKGSCVHVLSVIMGLSAKNKQRKLYEIMLSPSLDAETFPDTNISPESVLQQRPGVSGSGQPASKRSRN